MARNFKLTEKETEACDMFIKKHKSCCQDRPFSTLGMQFSYIICPGGLGHTVEIVCNECEEKENVTSISDW